MQEVAELRMTANLKLRYDNDKCEWLGVSFTVH